MDELDSESEAYLRVLCKREGCYYGKGEPLDDPVIANRPFEEQLLLETLANADLVKLAKQPAGFPPAYVGLTPKGRSYFKDKEAAQRAAQKKTWSDRRFTIFTAVLTFILSIFASVIASCVTVNVIT